MAQVIFLSDIVQNTIFGDSRYMGPHALSSQLCRAGYHSVVIDYFTRMDNFFDYLKKFIDSSTLMIGISTTFLARGFNEEELKIFREGKWSRNIGTDIHRSRGHWLDSEASLRAWFQELREKLNQFCPQCKIVLGGAKAHWAFYGLNTYENVDYISLSHMSESIVDFVRALEKKEEPKIYLHRGRKVIENRTNQDKEICPPTYYHANHAIQKKEALPIEISRGCAFNCKFCSFQKNGSYRKDLNILKDEFVRNYELFGTTVYHFCDDCFNDTRKKVEETCNLILTLPFKIEWVSYARVDVGVKFPETTKLMVESGAKGLYFGLESFNHSVAKAAGKGTPIESVKEFLLDSYKKYSDQCLFQGSFIVGLPGETVESQRETIRWVTENEALHFVGVGGLEVPYYNKSYETGNEFSDYSQNPDKYGFTNVSVLSNEWEHGTMNKKTAEILCQEFMTAWSKKRDVTFIRDVFSYPILRTLGYSEGEIREIALGRASQNFETESKGKFLSFLRQYWADLEKKNHLK